MRPPENHKSTFMSKNKVIKSYSQSHFYKDDYVMISLHNAHTRTTQTANERD